MPLSVASLRRLAGLDRLGPGHVGGPGPVAGLAGDVELRPGRRVGVRRRGIALLHVGRVALGAHEVPVLVGARPVQRVAEGNLLLRVEVEPALPSLLRRPGVPADVQRLVPPAGERDEVLLQRIDAEGVGDRVFVELSVGAVGSNEELPVPLEERRRHAEVRERGVAEVAEDGLGGRLLHRAVVVRPFPPRILCRVAGSAGSAPHESRSQGQRRRGRRPGGSGRRLPPAPAREDRGNERDRREESPEPAPRPVPERRGGLHDPEACDSGARSYRRASAR